MIDLDELERLHEAATPGPWASEGACIVAGPVGARMLILYDEGGPSRDDSALIAAVRNALPELLRLARRARRLEEAAREAEAILRHQPVPGLSCAASREEPDKLDSDGSCPGCTCELQMALAALRAALAEEEG